MLSNVTLNTGKNTYRRIQTLRFRSSVEKDHFVQRMGKISNLAPLTTKVNQYQKWGPEKGECFATAQSG